MNIYRIYNSSGDSYIGSTPRCIKIRFSEHISSRHCFNRADFNIELLEVCKDENRYDRENFYIAKYDSIANGYNKCLASIGPTGSSRSKKVIARTNKTKADNMPYFKIVNLKRIGVSMITNSYDRAAEYTCQSRDSVRKKLRNGRNCKMFKYEYMAGGAPCL